MPADNNHQMNSSAWSVTMDNGGAWYHIAIVSDNNIIRTFVNGNEAFRDYESTEMVGLYADSDDGRFRIGSSYWVEGTDTLDKFLHGNIQRVRISEGALEKSQWLISEPEQYAGEFGNNNDFALKNSKNYNMVFIPDTQNTIKFRPEVLETAIDELIENKKQYNLAGVIHLGDVTENYDDGSQYESARDIFNKLPENHIKLMIQPGNRDYGSFYDESFSRFSSSYMKLTNYYLKNDSPSGRSSYMFINAGSYRYMVVSLSYEDIEQDKAWLESVLNKNSKYPTILTSHDLQNASDSMPSAIKLSRTGKVVWEIIKNYNQVFMLFGGHSHGAGMETLTNAYGNEVFSILADYQFGYNGGNAFFKFAEFDEDANKIFLSTYSPYSASIPSAEKSYFDVNYMTGVGNYNELAIDFESRFSKSNR